MTVTEKNYQIMNQNCNSKFVLLCDHATNRIPKFISKTRLGLKSNFSRLIIDPNRSKDDPTSIMQIYDQILISGNCNLSKTEIRDRKRSFYDVYHGAISTFLKKKKGLTSYLVSLHSFTPKLNLEQQRPWHVGVLWGEDRRMADLVIDELEKYKEICVGKNKPYSGNLKGDTLSKHGISNKLPHVLLEIRNDLISDSVGQKKWALIIKRVLINSILKLEE